MVGFIVDLFETITDRSIQVIADADKLMEVAEIMKFRGVEFEDSYDMEELWRKHEVLSIARNTYSDGNEYWFQAILNNNGGTLITGSDITFIDENVLGLIDLDKIEGRVMELTSDEEYINSLLDVQ